MHEVLVNRLGGLSLPRKSVVRLTDRLDMTLDVYGGRKTTMQCSRARAYCACIRCGWGLFWTFLFSSLLFLPLSLWKTARYRLKYCLKGPLNPKQPTNQQPKFVYFQYLQIWPYVSNPTNNIIFRGESFLFRLAVAYIFISVTGNLFFTTLPPTSLEKCL